jgi:hypothetical protein
MDWYTIALQEYKEANELQQEYKDYLHLSNDAARIMVQNKLDKKFVEIVHTALKRERQYNAIRAQYDMGTVERTDVPIEQHEDHVIREESKVDAEIARIAINKREQYEELRAEM